MPCKSVKTLNGSISCTDIVPNKCLPGFFDLWQENGERRIVNGKAIVEVIEKEKDQKYHDLPVIIC